ncbi:MAG: glycine--tRNA ligase subunit beta [Helicobacteraceae bacterium]|nr:glycine--tRNA ligase subunit beta [Helicobacteraceae bacterium]
MKPLLIEIGFEEAPAAPLIRELGEIPVKYKNALEAFGFDSPFSFDFTPRRMAFFHQAFPSEQAGRVEIVYGPPIESAIAGGKPTAAALGFAKKCGVAFEELGRSTQKGREVLSYEKRAAPKPLSEVLGDLLTRFLTTLNLGRTMRWGSSSYEFARPVRWLLVLRGETAIDCELFGVRSGDFTFAHRSFSFEPQKAESAENYEAFLLKRGVVLSAKKRREIILTQFKRIENENNIRVEIDEALLDEVTAITEYPNALLGRFDRHFLELPKEAIITSMKTNQRYFAVFENGELSNRFVVVANALTDDFSAVIEGNEKVLRPRLSDALFFWRNDLKNGLIDEPLKGISYAQNLGSIYDKQERERTIVKRLQPFFGVKDEFADRAAALSKRDLATQMVYEFTELQGVMGMRYAQKLGENEAVALAIYEQYLPLGEESAPPSSQTGALLAIAVKIDSLMALFSIGSIPTGSKDPLGLRRAAASIVRIAVDRGWSLPIGALIKTLSDLYKPFDYAALEGFIKERLYSVLGGAQSVIRAVIAAGEGDALEIAKKVRALEAIAKDENFKENLSLFKRVANILKDQDASGAIDPALFEANEERELFEAARRVKASDYLGLLTELFALKKPLDRFFDAVMVNTDNPSVRANRLALLGSVYRRFLTIADIKEISF